ncbi:MAG: M61 family peptidase [Algoriphagus sp.]
MLHYFISCSKPTTQFVEIELRIRCSTAGRIRLQLPAWRAGRYQLTNFAQNIRGFQVHTSDGERVAFRKITKDCWELQVPYPGELLVSYSYWAGKMDAGSTWTDDQQVYLNLVNCCFEVLEFQEEEIEIQVHLPDYPQQVLTLTEVGPCVWRAKNFQELADATLLAAKELIQWDYRVGTTTFHCCFHGEVHFNPEQILDQFQAFTQRMMDDFGEFPESSYTFIFQLLPFPHYHGVEHRKGTVITFGPAASLQDTSAMEELLGISCHELYHAWNVCRIRPKELLPYDFSKETYTHAGWVLEGITTYFGDLYLLKSGVYDLATYLKHFEKIVNRESTQLGWKNYSILESSFDLWLDGYVPGIPERKVNIYSRGALISFCLDVLLLKEGRSLALFMSQLWKTYGAPFQGYALEEIEELLISQVGEYAKIRSFIDDYIGGKEDLFPLIQKCFLDVGISLVENVGPNPLLHRMGVIVDELNEIQRIHPSSKAFNFLMRNDRILNYLLEEESSLWKLDIDRQGRTLQLCFESEDGPFYPTFSLCPQTSTRLREEWIK